MMYVFIILISLIIKKICKYLQYKLKLQINEWL